MLSWQDLFPVAPLAVDAEFRDLPPQERFRDYIERVNPRFSFYPHTRKIIETLEATAAGEILNLMIWLPPGTGKSEIASRLFPAWRLSNDPRHQVGLASYGAELAQEMTREAREYFLEGGGVLSSSQRAKRHWQTAEGGSMWGAGFGGAVRGYRYKTGIVEDPHKSHEDIDSEVKRERAFRFWDQVWMNRLHLFADEPIIRIIVAQRMADNDLQGWLLSRPDSDKWTVLALDAIRDAKTPFEIGGANLLPDYRQDGELLVPDRLTAEVLTEQRSDEDAFQAMYQQRPRARSGKIVETSWFKIVRPQDVPALLKKGMGVDLAVSTKQSADYTVAFPGGIGVNGMYYLFNPYRDRQESPVNRARIASRARSFQAQAIGVESVAFQLSFVQELRVMPEMLGYQILEVDADRDKQARMRGWAHLAEAGLIHLVDDGSGWIDRFLDEVAAFPRGRHDDQIDALGILLMLLRDLKDGRYFVGGKRAVTAQTRAGR